MTAEQRYVRLYEQGQRGIYAAVVKTYGPRCAENRVAFDAHYAKIQHTVSIIAKADVKKLHP